MTRWAVEGADRGVVEGADAEGSSVTGRPDQPARPEWPGSSADSGRIASERLSPERQSPELQSPVRPSPETQAPERPVLASTVHDPDGDLLAALRRLRTPLREIFAGFAVEATDETDAELVRTLEDDFAALVGRAPADGRVGRHRRNAVRLALSLSSDAPPSPVAYSDLDHVLRWLDTDRGELERDLTELSADFVVIGRSPAAMDACPRRLRETEAIVNHVHELATGRGWDLMFAVRLMSPKAARIVVERAREDSIANDVEWPLVVEHAGLDIAYREADGLSYRLTEDFGAASDTHDDDPLQWADRLAIANQHVQTLRDFLEARTAQSPRTSAGVHR